MYHILIDIFLTAMLYGILFIIILKKRWSADNDQRKNDDDQDGGIIDWTPPTLDLPPGVSLSEDPQFIKNKEELLV